MTDRTPQERPVRIQRKRAHGWKMPANTVYVGRPTKFGNPWATGEVREWLKSVGITDSYDDRERAENCVYNYPLWVEHNLPVTMFESRARL